MTFDGLHNDSLGYESDPRLRAEVDQKVAAANESLDAVIRNMQEHYAKHRELGIPITPICGGARFLAWMKAMDPDSIRAHLHLAIYRMAQGITFHAEARRDGDAG